jgi:fucose 4-O-acetylase-like acetyltransferase
MVRAMKIIIRTLERGWAMIAGSFFFNLGMTVLLCVTFFLIPTWLSSFVDRKIGFAIAGFLLLIFQMNTSRLAKIGNRKLKAKTDEN